MLKPEVIHFIQFTSHVISHEYIKPGAKFELKRMGTGGTEFGPVLHHIKHGGQCASPDSYHYRAELVGKVHKPVKNPTLIVCLTDMGLDWDVTNANEPKAPVLFVDCWSSVCGRKPQTHKEWGCTYRKAKTIAVTK